MKIRIDVKLRTALLPFKRLAGAATVMENSKRSPFDPLFDQWVKMYSADMQRRFGVQARGGGEEPWTPLALSTGKRRDKGRQDLKRFGGAGRGFEGLGRGARESLLRDTQAKGTEKGRLVGAGRALSILIDTGTLRGALVVGGVGNVVIRKPKGIVFGIAGGSHPTGPTVGQIAHAHQYGNPEKGLPARPILVDPSPDLKKRMNAAALKHMRSIARG